MKRRQRTATVLGASLVLALTGCGGGGGASLDEFCDLAERAQESSDDLDPAFESGDPGDLEDALNDAVEDAEAALDAAPDDIKEAIETSVSGQKEFLRILEANDFDLVEAVEDPDFNDLLEDRDMERAGDDIEEYLEDECGIEPTSDTEPDTTEAAGEEPVTTDAPVVVPVDTTPADTTPADTTPAEPASDTLELDAEVGGTTVGTEDSPSAVYAAVLTNPSSDAVSNLQVDFTIFGEGDTVVGTGSAYVDLILPGQTRAVSGTTSLTAPAVRIEANYSGDIGMPYGLEEGDLPSGEFTFEGFSLTADEYSTGVIGLMKSSYPVAFESVEVSVIFRDAAGAIIGGGSDYATILENGQVGVEPSAYYQIPNVVDFDVYAAYATYELGD